MRTLALLTGITAMLIITATITPAQVCDHTSQSAARFENLRLLPPVKVRNYDGRNIEYTFEDARGIYAGSFVISKDTVIDETFAKDYKKGLWWVCFCVADRHLYFVRRVDPKQVRK